MYSYLGTQVEIAQQDGGERACDAQDNEHQQQEAKHVVGLRGPRQIEKKNN